MVTTVIVFVFLVIFGASAIAASMAWGVAERRRRDALDKRLQKHAQEALEVDADLLKRDETSGIAFYGRLLDQLKFTDGMRDQLAQADLKWSVGRLTAMMLVAAFVALNILIRIPLIPIYLVPLGVLLAGFSPYGYVLRKRKARLAAFEAQFPDALDFLSRAMRAGHAFSISLELLAEEALEPMAREIRQTFEEHNLGLSMEVALPNLARRVPLLDVRFFVAAVLLQTRTGGNLSEILLKLSYVIRERFKLKGQVRAMSAHGRLTGKLLTILPVVVVLLMMMVNPTYMKSLVELPYGRHLIGAAIVMQAFGYLVIRRIIDIKV